MVIIGSVAVNPANGARLGKGEGPRVRQGGVEKQFTWFASRGFIRGLRRFK